MVKVSSNACGINGVGLVSIPLWQVKSIQYLKKKIFFIKTFFCVLVYIYNLIQHAL